jgi:hypothetical protein
MRGIFKRQKASIFPVLKALSTCRSAALFNMLHVFNKDAEDSRATILPNMQKNKSMKN